MVAWLSALVLAASAAPVNVAPAPPAPRCVQIVGTSDVHGHLLPEGRESGSFKVEQGGLAAFGGYLSILRKRHPGQLLLLDGGDLFQGTVASNLSKGKAVIAAYNTLGYQGASLGNHEFDYGAEGNAKDLLGALEHRLQEARFPFLACNVFLKGTHQRPHWKDLAPSVLLKINGVKVGVIGAITPDTPFVTLPTNLVTLDFAPAAPEVLAQSKRLRRRGAQLVVLVAHIGGGCTSTANPDDLSTCKPQSELFKLLGALPKGTLDVAIGGHTHQYIAQNVDGVAVTESGSYSHSFGWIEACVGKRGKVTTTIHRPQDVCVQEWAEGGCGPRAATSGVKPATFLGEVVTPDAKVGAVLGPYLEQVKAKKEAPVGVDLAAPLVRAHDQPCALGQMVAEGMRQALPGAELGLTNAGGLRANLPAGALRYGQVFEVLPFDNRVVGLKLSGGDLVSFIVAPLEAGHGFPQLSGAKLIMEGKTAHVVLADGTPIVPERQYLLATNDFLATGGDGAKPVVTSLPKGSETPTAILVRDAFIDYLKKLPQPVAPSRL